MRYYTFAATKEQAAATSLPGYPWFRDLATAQIIRDAVALPGVIVVYNCDDRDIAPVPLTDAVLAFDSTVLAPSAQQFTVLA